MTLLLRICRCWLQAALCCLLGWGGGSAFAGPSDLGLGSGSGMSLVLQASQPDRDAWPAVTVLAEAGVEWRVDQAQSQIARFKPPTGPRENLGVQRQAVWLRVPLSQTPGDTGRWLLDVDYPSLDRIDVYLIAQGRLRLQARLGDHVAFAQRPMQTRSHAVELPLQPGQPAELWLRVQTTSSMVLPLHLMTLERLAEREAGVQMLQGLAAGIGLFLVVYALGQWLGSRNTSYLYYALSVAGTTLFFFAFEGLGPQHLWAGSAWLTRNMAPLAVLPAVAGSLPFLARSLRVAELNAWLNRLMWGTALAALALAMAFMVGALDYRQAHLAGTVMGLTPILLGLPVAAVRARQGDRTARFVLVGWGLYGVGIVVMALLLRGVLPVSPWTLHAFQVGSMLEILMWMRVLALQLEASRSQALQTEHERERLHTLAHTDVLTGLPNRRGLQAGLERVLGRQVSGRFLALYLIDLDGFKQVNDQFGHDAGDEVLVAVAQRLQGQLRSQDLVARLGGDEFVVVIADLPSEDEAHRLGQKLVDAFDLPLAVDGGARTIGLTVGYAMAPSDGRDAVGLLKAADAAMYLGKQAGKRCVRRSPPRAAVA
jgi:diguanylate cyclase